RWPALATSSPAPGRATHDSAAKSRRHSGRTTANGFPSILLAALAMFTRREATALLLGGVAASLSGKLFAADDKKAVGPDPKEWEKVVDKAVAYFRKTQGADG